MKKILIVIMLLAMVLTAHAFSGSGLFQMVASRDILYENLTTYTMSSGTSSYVSCTASQCTATSFVRGLYYIYKDMGSSYFNTLNVDFEFYTTSVADSSSSIVALAFSNTLATIYTFATTDISVLLYHGTSAYIVRGNWEVSGVYSTPITTSLSTLYYATLIRENLSDTTTLHIYSNAARTSEISGSPVTVTGIGTTQWRYIFVASGIDKEAGQHAYSGYVRNVVDWNQ